MQHVRAAMLKKQKSFLRLKEDLFYEDISNDELCHEFKRIHEVFDPKGKNEATRLKRFQRTRTLACWHDSSSISNASHFMVMFCTLYDPAIFYTDEEYFTMTGVYSTFLLILYMQKMQT